MRRLEVLDAQHEQHAKTKGEKFKSVFKGHDDCRWSNWKNMSAEDMLKHVVTTVFPFIQNLDEDKDTLYSKYMKGATFMIQKPSLLQEAVSIFDELNITNQNQDTQGDIYEYLLSKLKISGQNGQFRTPRHIIRMIVDLVNPQIGETVCDPACGTGGFLINAYQHIVKNNTSEDLIKYDNEDGTPYNLIGDKITKKAHWDLLKNKTFYGFDFEYTMIRIGLMNMILHGIRHPNITYADSLSKQFDQKKQYDIILANPPFAGSIDEGDIHGNFNLVTKKTELLFNELFYNILKIGGKAGMIVPTGILSTTSNAHIDLRKKLLESCQIEAIITMPAGIFRPYSGIETAVLIFTKGGTTEKIWFYEMKDDGYTLDDKRNLIDGKGDIPKIIEAFQSKSISENSFVLDVKLMKKNDYKFLPTFYKEDNFKKINYEKPSIILEKILKLDLDIQKESKNMYSVIKKIEDGK